MSFSKQQREGLTLLEGETAESFVARYAGMTPIAANTTLEQWITQVTTAMKGADLGPLGDFSQTPASVRQCLAGLANVMLEQTRTGVDMRLPIHGKATHLIAALTSCQEGLRALSLQSGEPLSVAEIDPPAVGQLLVEETAAACRCHKLQEEAQLAGLAYRGMCF